MSTEYGVRLYVVFFVQHHRFGDSSFTFAFCVSVLINEAGNCWKNEGLVMGDWMSVGRWWNDTDREDRMILTGGPNDTDRGDRMILTGETE
jgi:hypothetical protein